MMYQDEKEHHRPHVHVYYGDFEASIALDGRLLAGSLPAKQYKLVTAWLVLHEDELYEAWNKAAAGHPFERIKPLS
ncbi:DUF4160 domain-containing protein [Bifidobacterium sp. ESL0790]|uniref:DUF4160 domain-containing protein n=1 Tax=Bifidobacterium sp. ESL0790 TaxID=2983233 RepID=UPI0023F743A3|nr:DUF4160 domain-containing protein [Bifidobacterium sp. ESL0790]WEV72988.1 DUF4160 domain-containing protein [Bifidobacterium sp. ESL0790]